MKRSGDGVRRGFSTVIVPYAFCFLGSLAVFSCGFPELSPIPSVNGQPLAVAEVQGPTSVSGGSQITVSGEASSDPDGDPITFNWSQSAGPTVQIDDAAAQKITFQAPEEESTVVLALTVNDGTESSERALVEIKVRFNTTPVADAGEPVETYNLSSVTLKGGGEDKDGDAIVAYEWSVDGAPFGASYEISATDTAYPVFTPLGKGDYTLGLKVSDGKVWSTKVPVIVSSLNNPPSLTSTFTSASTTNTYAVALTVASSDADGDAVTSYEWSVLEQPAGSAYQLNALDAAAVFTPNGRGTYEVGVRASDVEGGWSDYRTFRVVALNAPPSVTVAAVDPIPNESTTYLNAAASDSDGDALTYSWTVATKPPGASVVMQSTGASPSFKPVGKGDYVVELKVSDGQAESAPVRTTITSLNRAPTADPGGPYTGLTVGATFTASGAGSYDVDGDALTYEWKVAGESETYVGETPKIAAPVIKGSATLELTVNDGTATHKSTTLIDVDNLPPVAAATAPTGVDARTTGRLYGAHSYDPDSSTALTYRWQQVSGPEVTLSNEAVSSPTFTAPDEPQKLTFQLEVFDGKAWSAPTEIETSVRPIDETSVFVSGDDGDDANPGTRDAPMRTISAAIGIADAASPKKSVVVAEATGGYTETVIMRKGVDVYGGFSTTSTWSRDIENHTTTIYPPAGTEATVMFGLDIELEPALLEGFSIHGPAGSAATGSTWAVLIDRAAATVRKNRIMGGGYGVPTTVSGSASAVFIRNTLNNPVLVDANYIENGLHHSSGVGVLLQKCQENTILRGNHFEMVYTNTGYGTNSLTNILLASPSTDCGPLVERNTIIVNGSDGQTSCLALHTKDYMDMTVKAFNNLVVMDSSCSSTNMIYDGAYLSKHVVFAFNTFIDKRSGSNKKIMQLDNRSRLESNYFQDFNTAIGCNTNTSPSGTNNVFVNIGSGTCWGNDYVRLESGDACTFANTSDRFSPLYYRLTGGEYCLDQGYRNPNRNILTDADGNERPYDVPGIDGPANSDGSDIGWSEYRP